ncbi:c-type cytochrome [Sphingosinicella sp. CPCC 101087]|uniref:c-type cytochrome n=1 Tax=Sphingosinicella sp. CPCC 101087 TaxID=2497754 RepID=UPI0013EA3B34|nr:c-type cytochrome [Sphingosinicella sp. CPCC 101087]
MIPVRFLSAALLLAGGCAPADRPAPDPFSESGELIALSGGRSGAQNACFTCHGLDGGGNGAGAPRLAALDVGYLDAQMEGYASGLRRHSQMEYIARQLSAAERQAVSLHYARMPRPVPPPGDALPAPAVPASGLPAQALYGSGDPARGLPACAACHGRSGEGVGAGNPPLAGQPAAYLAAQLDAWRAGKRRNDPENLMLRISRRLTPDEIRSVSAYASALGGPIPRPEPPESFP